MQERPRFETCPCCGRKNRRPEHPLCRDCNKIYSEQAPEAAANLTPFPNRVEWAHGKGVQTLLRLEQEHKDVSQVTKPLLEQAGQEIQEKLGRLDPEIFHTARLKRYRILLEQASPEVQEAARRERQLYAAICSLRNFLEGVEANRQDSPDDEKDPSGEEEPASSKTKAD